MDTMWRLLNYASKYWTRLAMALIIMVAATALSLVQPKIIQFSFNLGYVDQMWHLLPWFALIMVAATALRGFFNYLNRIIMEWVSQRTIYDLRNAIYRHLHSLSFSYFDSAQTGQLMSRATADVEMLRRFLSFGLLNLLSSAMTLVLILIILLTMDVQLTLISLATIPPLLFVLYKFAKEIRPRYRLIQQQLAELTNVLQENITGMRVVRAFAREEDQIASFHTENRKYLEQNVTTARLWAFYFPLMNFISGVGLALLLWLGGRRVIEGILDIGELAAFISFLLLLVMPIRMMGWLVNMAAQAVAAASRVFEILDTESDVKEKPGALTLKDVNGHVHLEGVSFGYEENLVLCGLDIDALPGKTIALLGATGSGKSTIINLIPRFYDVTDGKVTIDGIDVRDVTLDSLRQNIGLVLQETFLFSTTLRENIAYGRPGATEQQIVEAAKAARIHEFITTLPQGYDTKVGERGVGLSGGQKQRIAIARALLLNPKILILDEATSSVDTETEHLIQQALTRVMEGRTTFVIAQRLSTVKNADEIVILKDGKVAERGSHQELLQTGGMYSEIYDLQFRSQEQEGSEA
jgi:ATP-binding cassette subfamily B protein